MQPLDEDRLMKELRLEARDAIADKLLRLNDILGGADPASPQSLRQIRLEAHSLKGIGAAFNFPAVNVCAHRLEDYIADLDRLDDPAQRAAVQSFLDRLQEAVERVERGEGDNTADLVRRLPVKTGSTFDPGDIEVREVEVMLVAPAGAATRFVRQELAACGYRVVVVNRPLEALAFALHARPDLVVVSAVLEDLDGVDLICAFAAMPRTRDLPVALLTSMARDDERLRDLPPQVPILRKGGQFSDDVAEALARLRII